MTPVFDPADATPEQVDNSNPQAREEIAALTDAVDTLILDSLGGLDV